MQIWYPQSLLSDGLQDGSGVVLEFDEILFDVANAGTAVCNRVVSDHRPISMRLSADVSSQGCTASCRVDAWAAVSAGDGKAQLRK